MKSDLEKSSGGSYVCNEWLLALKKCSRMNERSILCHHAGILYVRFKNSNDITVATCCGSMRCENPKGTLKFKPHTLRLILCLMLLRRVSLNFYILFKIIAASGCLALLELHVSLSHYCVHQLQIIDIHLLTFINKSCDINFYIKCENTAAKGNLSEIFYRTDLLSQNFLNLK